MALLQQIVTPQPEPTGLDIPTPISRLRQGYMVQVDQSGDEVGQPQFEFLLFRSATTPKTPSEELPPRPNPIEVAVWQLVPYADPQDPRKVMVKRGPAVVHELADDLGSALRYTEGLAIRKGLVLKP